MDTIQPVRSSSRNVSALFLQSCQVVNNLLIHIPSVIDSSSLPNRFQVSPMQRAHDGRGVKHPVLSTGPPQRLNLLAWLPSAAGPCLATVKRLVQFPELNRSGNLFVSDEYHNSRMVFNEKPRCNRCTRAQNRRCKSITRRRNSSNNHINGSTAGIHTTAAKLTCRCFLFKIRR